jgi:hypothetical protein
MNVFTVIFVLVCLSGTKPAPSRREPKVAHRQIPVAKPEDVPTIGSQKDGGPGHTMIEIKNPRDVPVWIEVECVSTQTVVALGLPARTSAKFNVVSFGGTCRIRDWRAWVEHKTPTPAHAHGSNTTRPRRTETAQ